MSSTSVRRPLVILAAAAAAGALVLASAAPADAAPFYSEGDCHVNHLSDGPVAGNSQCAGEDFGGIKMGQSAFMNANLTGADFSGTDVQASSFRNAKIGDTDFTRAKVDQADFTGAGIVPETLVLDATSPEGVPVTLTPSLPTGMEFGGCTIAGTTVDAGAMFPVGTTGLLCKFTTGQPGAAIAVVQVQVTMATPVAEEPLFTNPPATAASDSMFDSPATWLWIGGAGILVVGGIVAFAVSQTLRRRNG